MLRWPQTMVASTYLRATPEPRWLASLHSRDHRIEFAMVQQTRNPHNLPSGHQVGLVTRFADDLRAELPAKSAGRPATGPQARIRRYAIRHVVVVETVGRLSDVVEKLDRAIQLALADGPRGVVCDLSAVLEGAEPVSVEMLATAGRHVRDWPAIPVAVACPDQQVREALRAHPLGRHLIVTKSLFCSVSAVLATPTLTIERLQLAPHPTAPHAARDFVTRTLLDWQLHRVIPSASLVVSELVASSSINAGTDIDLSIVWNLGALRLTVRDNGPDLPSQPHSGLDLHGQSLTVVAGLSRAFGALPTANGGKVVWAVLDAPRRPPPTNHHRPADERQEALILNDAQALAGQPSRRILERSHR